MARTGGAALTQPVQGSGRETGRQCSTLAPPLSGRVVLGKFLHLPEAAAFTWWLFIK